MGDFIFQLASILGILFFVTLFLFLIKNLFKGSNKEKS